VRAPRRSGFVRAKTRPERRWRGRAGGRATEREHTVPPSYHAESSGQSVFTNAAAARKSQGDEESSQTCEKRVWNERASERATASQSAGLGGHKPFSLCEAEHERACGEFDLFEQCTGAGCCIRLHEACSIVGRSDGRGGPRVKSRGRAASQAGLLLKLVCDGDGDGGPECRLLPPNVEFDPLRLLLLLAPNAER
jgi:hypothetical protein